MTNTIKTIERAAKKSKRAAADQPTSEDPREELRHLVREHMAVQVAKVGAQHRSTDRKNRATGDTIKCRLPLDLQAEYAAFVKRHDVYASDLERRMTKALRKVPIYDVFLRHVYGVGPVLAAYLCAEVDIRKAEKPSNLRKFCGMIVDRDTGRLIRPRKGERRAYNADIRTKLFVAFGSMWKNAAKKSVDRPNGSTCKYLDIWRATKHRELHSERIDAPTNKWRDMGGETHGGAAAHCHKKGWHKAADILIQDLYVVWRSVEGLPVWPTYREAMLGYEHGGNPIANAPRMLTVEEALARVGDVGARPTDAPVEDVDLSDDAVEDDVRDLVNALGGEAE